MSRLFSQMIKIHYLKVSMKFSKHTKKYFFNFLFYVFFTNEDNALSVGMGVHLQEGDAFEAKLIRQGFGDVIAHTELKTKKTKYIKEKTSCTDEGITLESLGPDLAQAVIKDCHCYPKEFPLQLANPDTPFCEDTHIGRYCFRGVWRNFVKENFNLQPCTKFEFAGKFELLRLDEHTVKTQQLEHILQGENVTDKKTNFIVTYIFQPPETLLLIEEYYVVPTLDLIGLIGGTLGMFVGFSIYGTFSDGLRLALSIVKKMKNAGKNYKGFPEKPC